MIEDWYIKKDPGYFIERKESAKESEKVFEELKDTNVIFNLWGAHGTGKTAYILNLVNRSKDKYSDGYYIDCINNNLKKVHLNFFVDKFNKIIKETVPDNKEQEVLMTIESTLKRKKSVLIIYDNILDTENCSFINQLCGSNIQIIFISHLKAQVKKIDIKSSFLSYFSKNEIKEVVLKYLKFRRNNIEELDDIKINTLIDITESNPYKLIKVLQYICNQNIDIDSFIKENKTKMGINNTFLQKFEAKDQKTINLYNQFLEKIKDEKVLECIYILSYLQPINIPRKFLLYFCSSEDIDKNLNFFIMPGEKLNTYRTYDIAQQILQKIVKKTENLSYIGVKLSFWSNIKNKSFYIKKATNVFNELMSLDYQKYSNDLDSKYMAEHVEYIIINFKEELKIEDYMQLLYKLGLSALSSGNVEKSIVFFLECVLNLENKVNEKNYHIFLQANYYLADSYRIKSDIDLANKYFEKILKIVEEPKNKNDILSKIIQANVKCKLALINNLSIEQMTSLLNEAYQTYNECTNFSNKNFFYIETARYFIIFSGIKKREGDYENAYGLMQIAENIYEEAAGEISNREKYIPGKILTSALFAVILNDEGKSTEALEKIASSYRLCLNHYKSDFLRVKMIFLVFGLIYINLNNLQEASKNLKSYLNFDNSNYKEVQKLDNPSKIWLKPNLDQIKLNEIEIYEEIIVNLIKIFNDSNFVEIAYHYYRLAFFQKKLFNLKESLNCYQNSRSIINFLIKNEKDKKIKIKYKEKINLINIDIKEVKEAERLLLINRSEKMEDKKILSNRNENLQLITIPTFNGLVFPLSDYLYTLTKFTKEILNELCKQVDPNGLLTLVLNKPSTDSLQAMYNLLNERRKSTPTKKWFDERIGVEQFNLLHICVLTGNLDLYQELRNKAPSKTDLATASGLWPEHLAALVGNAKFFENYFEQEVRELHNIILGDSKNQWQLNPLHFAILANQADVVSNIFTNIPKLMPAMPIAYSIFHFAIAFSDVETLQRLLAHTYTGQTMGGLLAYPSADKSPLAFAARNGKYEHAVYLYNQVAAYTNETDSLQLLETAFYEAALAGQKKIVKYFLSQGFIPEAGHKAYNKTMFALRSNESDLQQTIYQLIETAALRAKNHLYEKPKPKSQFYETKVYQGGGMKGVLYPYADDAFIWCCEQRGQSIIGGSSSRERRKRLQAQAVVRVCGTSAGAIFAFLQAIGLSNADLKQEMARNFGEFLGEHAHLATVLIDDNTALSDKAKQLLKTLDINLETAIAKIEKIVNDYQQTPADAGILSKGWGIGKNIAGVLSHFNQIKAELTQTWVDLQKLNSEFKGLVAGKEVLEWLQALMHEQQQSYAVEGIKDIKLNDKTTFGEWGRFVQKRRSQGDYRFKHLYVVVTCLDTQEAKVLSSENPDYSEYCMLSAVRASMSLPIIFEAVPLTNKNKDGSIAETRERYADGGMLANYIIGFFDKKGFTHADAVGDPDFHVFNPSTIGFQFKETKETKKLAKSYTVIEYLWHLGELFYHAENIITSFMNTAYYRSIELPVQGMVKNKHEQKSQDFTVSTMMFRQFNEEETVEIERIAATEVCKYFTCDVQDYLKSRSTGNKTEVQTVDAKYHDNKEVDLMMLDDTTEIDAVALASQRAIKKINVNGIDKDCLVANAKPDGNCGFSATKLALSLQSHSNLAEEFTRQNFIDLVLSVYQESKYKKYVEDILIRDNCNNVAEWQEKFKSSGYWMEDPHFKLLSHNYNIAFNFYALPNEGIREIFQPEIGNKIIDENENNNNKINVHLARVSTQLIDESVNNHNHFDAIIVEPNTEQKSIIEKIKNFTENDNIKKYTNSFSNNNFWSSSKESASSQNKSSVESFNEKSGYTRFPK